MDLVLLGANEGPFIDVGMDLDVRVIAELQGILRKRIVVVSSWSPAFQESTDKGMEAI